MFDELLRLLAAAGFPVSVGAAVVLIGAGIYYLGKREDVQKAAIELARQHQSKVEQDFLATLLKELEQVRTLLRKYGEDLANGQFQFVECQKKLGMSEARIMILEQQLKDTNEELESERDHSKSLEEELAKVKRRKS